VGQHCRCGGDMVDGVFGWKGAGGLMVRVLG